MMEEQGLGTADELAELALSLHDEDTFETTIERLRDET
jgi:hypothetical protein